MIRQLQKIRKNRIRVVHILHSFSTGGMEKGIAAVVKGSSHLYEHIILCITQTGRSEELLPKEIQVISLNKPSGNSLSFIIKLSKLLKKLDPDVIHTRNWGGLDGVLAARVAGITAIVHGEHGWGVIDTNGLNFKRVIIRRFISLFITEYTCVSKQMVGWIKNDIKVRNRVTQIYNGVDHKYYAPAPKKKDRKELVMGIVGRLDPIKDHPTLFSAFAKVKKIVPGIRLLVIGDGPEKEKLKALATSEIVFLGNRRDVPILLQQLDIFILPSLNEGISNTILEAMATELPVVASNVGGNPELVKDGVTGRLFDAGNVEDLTLILSDYCRNARLRNRHGKNGRQRAIRKFSMEAMINQYTGVWKRLSKH